MHFTPDLTGRTWVRLEAWDIAGNGAFTQPVWLGPSVLSPRHSDACWTEHPGCKPANKGLPLAGSCSLP